MGSLTGDPGIEITVLLNARHKAKPRPILCSARREDEICDGFVSYKDEDTDT